MYWFYKNGRLIWNAQSDGTDATRDAAFRRSMPVAWDHAAETHEGNIVRLFYQDGDFIRSVNVTVHTSERFFLSR